MGDDPSRQVPMEEANLQSGEPVQPASSVQPPPAVQPEKRATRAVLNAAEFVPHLLTASANAMTASGSRWFFATYGFGLNEGRIIGVLGHRPGLTAAQLGQAMSMNKSIVSRGLANLQQRELIRGVGPVRGRQSYLTETGQRLHDEIVASAYISEDVILEGFSPRQREQMLEMLKKLHANVQKYFASGNGEDDE